MAMSQQICLIYEFEIQIKRLYIHAMADEVSYAKLSEISFSYKKKERDLTQSYDKSPFTHTESLQCKSSGEQVILGHFSIGCKNIFGSPRPLRAGPTNSRWISDQHILCQIKARSFQIRQFFKSGGDGGRSAL